MLSILINAYACSPDMGSEPGMAWNWCVNLANYCELYIITEGEFQEKIEEVLPTLPQGKNMHFFYNPVSDKIRKMCWNQGDWRFYKHYKKWQWKTYKIALDIIPKYHIDMVHQLNMIGFREPGYLWKIEDKPFVWGPIGGLKQFPAAYLHGAGWKSNIFMRLKNGLNVLQLKYGYRVNKALHRADLLISSIPNSYEALKRYKNLESVIIPETGCFTNSPLEVASKDEKRFRRSYLHVLWVGKFDFRKRLDIALKAIASAANSKIYLQVYGSGNEWQMAEYKKMAENLGVDEWVEFMGNRTNREVQEAMDEADIFLFTSVNEDTSTVVLEAVSHHLPVLCFDTCGMASVIDNQVGCKVALSNPKRSVEDFSHILNDLYRHREKLEELSDNCKIRQQELSWDNKARQMVALYEEVLAKTGKCG